MIFKTVTMVLFGGAVGEDQESGGETNAACSIHDDQTTTVRVSHRKKKSQ